MIPVCPNHREWRVLRTLAPFSTALQLPDRFDEGSVLVHRIPGPMTHVEVKIGMHQVRLHETSSVSVRPTSTSWVAVYNHEPAGMLPTASLVVPLRRSG